ncbi:MAG: hypothetical protein RBS01_04000 [Candidatus Dojkabacteria bacterium]|jgi:hypothetical protein|nr:hypothetical protein [Candidatus Dojkabacteria bacterium]
MKVSEYIKKYTSGERVHFFSKSGVTGELIEVLEEILKWNVKGIKEEWEDLLHFLQLWMYWRLGLNQEIWECTSHSVNKFISRVEVWKKLYKYCNLSEDISGFAGNYNRKQKVINHLGKFGISENKAIEAYNSIVE